MHHQHGGEGFALAIGIGGQPDIDLLQIILAVSDRGVGLGLLALGQVRPSQQLRGIGGHAHGGDRHQEDEDWEEGEDREYEAHALLHRGGCWIEKPTVILPSFLFSRESERPGWAPSPRGDEAARVIEGINAGATGARSLIQIYCDPGYRLARDRVQE